MRARLSFLLSLALTAILVTPAAAQDIRQSVVKIFTTSRQPDITRPWSKSRPEEATGTGVVIEGNRILTNAHVVNYASRILVQPYQSGERYEAEVIARTECIDLAILSLEDESFFDKYPAATFADELPRVGSTASAYGYPIGGDELSITEGIVSRIEYTQYNFESHGLRIQVDTPLNPGNSGGPATVDDRVIGLVFSGIDEADNIGYLIPTSEIHAFLEAAERNAASGAPSGAYRGRPFLMDLFQNLENPALREKLGLEDMEGDTTGVMVLDPWDEPDYPLKQWDVVTAIGGVDIDNTGMIQEKGLRLYFEHLCSKFEADGQVPLSIIRDGERLEVAAPVTAKRPRIFNYLEINNDYPSYFIFGPVVFTPVYGEHVNWLGSFLAPRGSPIALRAGDKPDFEDQGFVVVPSPLFPHRMTKGYDMAPFPTLKTVNGVEIRNMRHLVETLRGIEDDYVVFEWYDRGADALVFKRDEAIEATEEILDDNGIRRQMSEDLEGIWEE
ncbi:MAG: trypsin-like peptidase domain-containing protein [Phycisphaerales bacterium JB039]